MDLRVRVMGSKYSVTEFHFRNSSRAGTPWVASTKLFSVVCAHAADIAD
jgi:hypothetical protein